MSLGYLFGFIDGKRGLELTRMTFSTLLVATAICFSQLQSSHRRLAAVRNLWVLCLLLSSPSLLAGPLDCPTNKPFYDRFQTLKVGDTEERVRACLTELHQTVNKPDRHRFFWTWLVKLDPRSDNVTIFGVGFDPDTHKVIYKAIGCDSEFCLPAEP